MAANPIANANPPSGPRAIHRQYRVLHNAAIIVAVAIAIASPLVFAVVGYLDVIDLRRFQGELTARQVAAYAYVQGPTWRFSEHRIAELVRQIAPANDLGRQIITSVDGGASITVGAKPVFPVARTSVPIRIGPRTIGTVAVEATLRPLLAKIALAIFIGVILSWAAYACVRFPLVKLSQAVDAFRASEAQFRSLASAAPMAIAITDLDGRFRWANNDMLHRIGMTIDELVDKTVYDIHPDEIADEIDRLDNLVVATRKPQIAEFTMQSAGGVPVPEINVRFPIVDDGGTVIGLGSAAVDISAQRTAENQLRRAHRLQAVGQLTGGIAHDFNNLLQVIETTLGLAKDMIPGESKAATLVDAAAKAGRRGGELTRKLLAFSRQQLLRPQRLDVDAWLRAEINLLARTLGEDIDIQITPCDQPAVIVVDEGNLTNAILNLAINARTAMPEGGRLTFSTSRRHFAADVPIENEVLPTGDYVEIAVTDTGCGMTEEILNHAVEPFFTTKGVGEGSGLGLSMVYGFTRQSGGTVSIESEVNKGTTVRVLLPAAKDPMDVAPENGVERLADTGDYRLKVLLVEDDAEVRRATVSLLQSFGCEVVDAENSALALQGLEQDSRIQLLLSDILLPGGQSGIELAQEASHLWPELKIILMSGYPDAALAKANPAAIPFPIINKPFSKAILSQALASALAT